MIIFATQLHFYEPSKSTKIYPMAACFRNYFFSNNDAAAHSGIDRISEARL